MTMPDYDTSKPVLVTGATGYVAGWLVKRLLEEGFHVHAAVRNPDDTAKVGHLTALAQDLPGKITLFKTDLLAKGSYAAAMKGCGVVFHTASPFTSRITDPQRDLVDPALNGTANVLITANQSTDVTRIVLTSSCAAIYGDIADLDALPGHIVSEKDWNTTSTLTHQAYSYSKTVAERAAWDISKDQNRWKLVVVNPSLVLGPGLADRQTSESFNLIKQLCDGTMRTGAPDFSIGAVDVRDVAEAHMRAAFIPEAEGRHIVSARSVTLLEIAQILRAKYGKAYAFPTGTLPTWLVWLIGPVVNKMMTRKSVALNMGKPWKGDNSKSKQALGLTYRPLEPALAEMLDQMTRTGQVRKKG